MARSIDAIQSDLERTRQQLASTLDELADRANPNALADDAKQKATSFARDPKVQKVLLGIGIAVAGVVILTVRGKRKQSKEIKEIQKLLAAHRNG
ncbi:DUF3618 domain-containing protein [Corynebacterium kroppenstedtii]|uniref:DUF3618 domain-containing protein n=1 Tax=Corynebacterium sp. PCR 32 TaxID=3351342 RepID=UPI0030AF9AFB